MLGGPEAGAGGADVDERGTDAEGSAGEPEPHESGDAGSDVERTERNAAVVEPDDEDPATDDPDDPDDLDDPAAHSDEDTAPESAPADKLPQPGGDVGPALSASGSAEEPEDLAEPASAPAPRFVPPPYDPT